MSRGRLQALALVSLLTVPTTRVTEAGAQQLVAGELEYGEYAVGFEHRYVFDPQRPSPLLAARNAGAADDPDGRPIRISLWYPATPTGSPHMKFGRYFDGDGPNEHFARLDSVLEAFDRWSYGGMFSEGGPTLDDLLSVTTGAIYRSTPAPGPFPIFVYAPGWYSGSHDNAVMAEFLASHGYVVLTVSQLGSGTFGEDFGVTRSAVYDEVIDLEVGLQSVGAEAYADSANVVAGGFSMGGIVALLIQQRNDAVKALIGLDGSFVSDEGVSFLDVDTDFVPEATDVPTLAFHRGHPRQAGDVTSRLVDSLARSDRCMVAVSHATHGEFSNEPNLFEALGTDWIRSDFNSLPEAVRAHSAVMDYTLRFIDYVFEGSGPPFDWPESPAVELLEFSCTPHARGPGETQEPGS